MGKSLFWFAIVGTLAGGAFVAFGLLFDGIAWLTWVGVAVLVVAAVLFVVSGVRASRRGAPRDRA